MKVAAFILSGGTMRSLSLKKKPVPLPTNGGDQASLVFIICYQVRSAGQQTAETLKMKT